MKRYIAKAHRYPLVSLDMDTNEVDIVETDYVIDNLYLTKGAGELYVDGKKVTDVTDNGIIIKLYSLDDGKPIFINMEHKELTEYLKKREEEKLKECELCKSC